MATTKNIQVEYRSLQDAPSNLIEPGASMDFMAWSRLVFRPDELLLPGPGTLRLDRIRVGNRLQVFGGSTGMPSERTKLSGGVACVDLRVMPDRTLNFNEYAYFTLTNVGTNAVHARPILSGSLHSTDGSALPLLSMRPVILSADATREFWIPNRKWLASHTVKDLPERAQGTSIDGRTALVGWRPTFDVTITKIRIESASRRGDGIDLIEMRVGNLCQTVSCNAELPIALFREPRPVRIPVKASEHVAFYFDHDGEEDFRPVEIELEVTMPRNPKLDELNDNA